MLKKGERTVYSRKIVFFTVHCKSSLAYVSLYEINFFYNILKILNAMPVYSP